MDFERLPHILVERFGERLAMEDRSSDRCWAARCWVFSMALGHEAEVASKIVRAQCVVTRTEDQGRLGVHPLLRIG